ncbi:MAG: bifunctional hydroxymethylpyrimidine kinase/phosphomethylpyrimidine kinase [Rhodospirillaceae bacterium]|nr:bifunctional hydroxymethylpyrimidine kinase/phosphomethylpyrimidine kinase [Rhodospirillaceae bacterium]MBT5079782.1 bifunctional hydroxymethylpyrimidine kinase/phosphomethylpyrimidine kinase [Rhodospirillaceae bacterium]MBT5523779.1 bifunctional hydroxymethylpyrimidine kinase/phosphomethylpyrimidine kinase [Rhodospirillaceae bacterium]MBT5881633.1 bifunctional hydroxymethylpyrimidine kinase/phosphomethylpyrimidine kinase [Rhodospirillaceae bacterium]MBT6591154.1 bifunctional hydroxymethylpy
MVQEKGRVLIIAGSDSGGGAGIQADIKTVTALGGYAASAVTALTAQNTNGVHGIFEVPPEFVSQQIDVVLDDIGADAIKTGMLHRTDVLDAVIASLEKAGTGGGTSGGTGIPLVVDPVMVAKGGASLLDEDTRDVVRRRLIPRATVVTPNIPEAEILAEMSIRDEDDMIAAGRKLLALGPKAVLMKGGHLEQSSSGEVVDLLLTGVGVKRFTSARIESRHTHGTGCTLASALACGLAQGLAVEAAVERARIYVLAAIMTAPGLGSGHGPLNHGHTIVR